MSDELDIKEGITPLKREGRSPSCPTLSFGTTLFGMQVIVADLPPEVILGMVSRVDGCLKVVLVKKDRQ